MKSRFRFRLCCACMLALAITGCKVKGPGDVVSESKMKNSLYDYYLVKPMGDNLLYNENYKKTLYLDAVFKKYGTTEAILDSFLVWYTRSTEVLPKIYEKVNKRLKARQNEINYLIVLRDNKPKMSEPGNSIDVWPWKCLVRLTGETMSDQYVFVSPANTSYRNHDISIWEVRYHFLEPMLADPSRVVTMAMQVIYEKDTLDRLKTITDPDVHQLRLYADTLGMMKKIKGFIYYPGVQGEKVGASLADCFPLTRCHCPNPPSVAERGSINQLEALKTDFLKEVFGQKDNKIPKDSSQKVGDLKDNQHISPEEMNRRRTVTSEKEPEQIEVEQHIQQKKIEQKKEWQLNQRRNQQRRQSPSY